MIREPSSLYLSCRRETTPALKAEVARRFPSLRFSYSRPGFLTYKIPELPPDERHRIEERLGRLFFARSAVYGLGRVPADQILEPGGLAGVLQEQKFDRIHVWEPDGTDSPRGRYEPGLSEKVRRLHHRLFFTLKEDYLTEKGAFGADICDFSAKFGEICLDVILDDAGNAWLGWHRVRDFHGQFPGGLLPLELPTDAASRAWLKFEEGIRWSRLPIRPGSRCADLGASPGGGSQALLARGAEVLGIDPAEIDPRVTQNPQFTHLRGKIGQLPRKAFRKTAYLLADMNVAPDYTLSAIEELVTRPDVSIRGLLFTLKLFDWSLAEKIPDYLARVKSWGFSSVQARQLVFNHQEIMVAGGRFR